MSIINEIKYCYTGNGVIWKTGVASHLETVVHGRATKQHQGLNENIVEWKAESLIAW